MTAMIDCLIVGGGPAGLTAAIYAARFRLTVRVIDSGNSRAALIPCTRNHAGFPDGIAGSDLLVRMRRQAVKCGASVGHGTATRLQRVGESFAIDSDWGRISARAVLLATGVTNRRPDIPGDLHAAAMTAGRLRYCPVCDGFEVTDQNVAVIGTGAHGVKEAIFLRSYTDRVTLISPDEAHELDREQLGDLGRGGIAVVGGPPQDFELSPRGLSLSIPTGRMTFDAVYPALGSRVHSDLARNLDAAVTDEGCIKVDAHQRSSVPGLYAAGDVVIGLDQISHAMGEAGVAATTLRNDLAKDQPPRR